MLEHVAKLNAANQIIDALQTQVTTLQARVAELERRPKLSGSGTSRPATCDEMEARIEALGEFRRMLPEVGAKLDWLHNNTPPDEEAAALRLSGWTVPLDGKVTLPCTSRAGVLAHCSALTDLLPSQPAR